MMDGKINVGSMAVRKLYATLSFLRLSPSIVPMIMVMMTTPFCVGVVGVKVIGHRGKE